MKLSQATWESVFGEGSSKSDDWLIFVGRNQQLRVQVLYLYCIVPY
jgi:hypothetical protein